MNRVVLRLLCAVYLGLALSVVAALASETAPSEAVIGRFPPRVQAIVKPFVSDLSQTDIIGFGPTGLDNDAADHFRISSRGGRDSPQKYTWRERVSEEDLAEAIRPMMVAGFFDLPKGKCTERNRYSLAIRCPVVGPTQYGVGKGGDLALVAPRY